MANPLCFLRFIGKHRFKDPMYRLKIGRALHAATNGGREGLELWILLSELYNKKSFRRSLSEFYNSFSIGSNDIRPLFWYANEDNPKGYRLRCDLIFRNFIEGSSLKPQDVWDFISLEYYPYFVYSNGEWYHYLNNVWRKCSVEVLQTKIRKNLRFRLKKCLEHFDTFQEDFTDIRKLKDLFLGDLCVDEPSNISEGKISYIS